MEWPSIVTNFFAQTPHGSHHHHEGINYTNLLSLGSANQHANQQMGVNFDGNGNPRYASVTSQVHRHQLNLTNLEALQQVQAAQQQQLQQINNNHAHASSVATTSALHVQAAHIPHVPQPSHVVSEPPQPQVVNQNTVNADTLDMDGRSSSHSSSRHTAVAAPTVPERKAFTCKQCGEVFYNEEALMQHLRFFHKDVMPFTCQLCNDKFEKRSLLQNHLRKRHHVETPKSTKKVIKLDNGFFGCDLCDRTFNRQFKVYAHRKTHFPKRFKCYLCDQMFFEKKYMLLHIQRHKKSPSGNVRRKYGPPQKKDLAFFCDQCNKGFTLQRSLELHLQVIHQGIKPFKCHLCEMGFWKHAYLQSHCKRVHACDAKPPGPKKKTGPRTEKGRLKKEQAQKRKYIVKRNINGARTQRNRHARDHKFFCEFCSQTYTNQSVFILHQQKHLGVAKKTPCWLCKEYFEDESKMNEHLLEVHNQEPVKHVARSSSGYYECQDCDDVFQRSRKYYFHRLKKHGEKRIICAFCSKGFVSIGTYKCHRNIHVGAKPFMCPYCKVGFANRANLNLHVIRSHYRYNPLWCGACNKIYASEDMFKTHKEEHEGKFPFMCSICYKGFDDEEEHKKHASGFHKPQVDKKYTCHQCRKGFAYPKLLQRHIQICNKPKLKQHKCQFCERRYSYMCSLKDHYKKCPKNVDNYRPEPARKKPAPIVKNVTIPDNVTEIDVKVDYVCKICLFPFPDRQAVLKHAKENHEDKDAELTMICCFRHPDDERDFTKEDEIIAAEPEIFIRLITFYCQICKIPYCSPSLLEKHVTKYHPNFLNRYKELNEEMTPLTGLMRMRSTRTKSGRRSGEKTDTEDFYNEIAGDSEYPDTEAMVDDHESEDDENTEDSDFDDTPKKKPTKQLPPENPKRKSARLNKDADNKTEEPPKYFSCKTCKSLFNDKSAIDKHVNKYHLAGDGEAISEKDKLEFEYICELCDMHYTQQDGLLSHIESNHEDIFRKMTEIEKNTSVETEENDNTNNQVTFDDLDDLIDDNDLTCKVCDIKYTKRFFLKKHIEKYHPNYPNDESPLKQLPATNTELQCKVCNITYNLQSYLDKHIEKYHNNYPNADIVEEVNPAIAEKKKKAKIASDEDLTCKICNILYYKSVFLEKHIEKYHPNYPEKSGEEITVEKNMAKDALKNSKKYKCPECPVSYSMEHHWVRHMELFHPNFKKPIVSKKKNVNSDDWDSEVNKFICKFCKIEYTKDYFLAKHIERLHPNYYDKKEPQDDEDDLHYYCKVCKLPYFYRNNLENHIDKYHPDYYIVYPEDYRPLNGEIEDSNLNEAQDSNATEIQEPAPDKPELPKASHIFSHNVGTFPTPISQPVEPTTDTEPPQESEQHNQTNVNQFNSSTSGTTTSTAQTRANCLYQQPRPNNQPPQTQTGFQNCYVQQQQQHHALPHANASNSVTNPANVSTTYSNYNNPCDALSFLDNHLREEPIRVENNQQHFTRGTNPAVHHPPMIASERNNYFDNNNHHINPGTGNDFSYWDRVITQPVPIPNNVAPTPSFAMASYNPADSSSFHALQNRPQDRSGNVFTAASASANPVMPTANPDSDGDDPYMLPDTGFGLNYDSDDSVDDAKVGKNGPNLNTPKKSTETVTKVNKFEENFLQFSKKTHETPEVEAKEDEAVKEAKSKAFFCKKCPMYYLRDYFLDKHYQKEHPDFWDELQASKPEKSGNKDNADGKTSSRKGAISCKLCTNLYNTELMMMRHYKSQHPDEPETAAAVEELEAMLKKIQKSKSEYLYVCEICSKTYQRKLSLQKHFNATHMNIRPFKCADCDKTFTSKHSMNRHAANVHINQDNLFECERCKMHFKKKETMEKHNKNIPDCLERKEAAKKSGGKRRTKKKNNNETTDDEEEEDEDDIPLARRTSIRRNVRSKSKAVVETDEESSSKDVDDVPAKTSGNRRRAVGKKKKDIDSALEELSDFEEEIKPKSKKKQTPNSRKKPVVAEQASRRSTRNKRVSFKKYTKDSDEESVSEDEIAKEKPQKSSDKNIVKIKLKKISYQGGSDSDDDLDISKSSRNVSKNSDDDDVDQGKNVASKRKSETQEEVSDGENSYSDASLEYTPKKAKIARNARKNINPVKRTDDLELDETASVSSITSNNPKTDNDEKTDESHIVKSVQICLEKLKDLNE